MSSSRGDVFNMHRLHYPNALRRPLLERGVAKDSQEKREGWGSKKFNVEENKVSMVAYLLQCIYKLYMISEASVVITQ